MVTCSIKQMVVVLDTVLIHQLLGVTSSKGLTKMQMALTTLVHSSTR